MYAIYIFKTSTKLFVSEKISEFKNHFFWLSYFSAAANLNNCDELPMPFWRKQLLYHVNIIQLKMAII